MSTPRIRLIGLILFFGWSATSSADLLVHYTFDEMAGSVAFDSSGNAYDGAIADTTNWVDGIMGGALQFTGTGYVTLPADAMEFYSDNGSVAFWMSADVPTGIYTMFWAGDNTTGGGFGAENEMHVHLESAVADIWAGGELSFFAIADPNVHLFSDPEKGTVPGTPPVNPWLLGDTYWHHIAATWSDVTGSIKLYLDGELITEAEYVSTAYPLNVMYLGQMAAGNRRFIGMLDDVQIFSHALTDQEVTDIVFGQSAVHDDIATNPQEFVLNQNYPNPFNPTTTISYQLSNGGDVFLAIYNSAGQKVRTLVQGHQGAGSQSLTWDGRDDSGQQLGSGIYLCRLQVDNKVHTQKMMLMK